MYHSYVMGIGHAILELKSKGFDIRNDGKNYRVSFPKELSSAWEDFISQHLELGYWNEYLTESGVVFIFHLEDGIKRFEVEDFRNDEVLSLCEKLCERSFGSLWQMLTENRYYKEILCK